MSRVHNLSGCITSRGEYTDGERLPEAAAAGVMGAILSGILAAGRRRKRFRGAGHPQDRSRFHEAKKAISRLPKGIPVKNRIRHMAIVLLLAFLAAGCASLRGAPLQKASDTFTRRAGQFSPPPGQAAIYVIRPFGFAGAGSSMSIFIDHKKFGKLPVGSFLYGEIQPREHILESAEFSGVKNASLRFKAEEGRCYFFYATVGWNLNLESLPDDEGKRFVNKYEQSGDNMLDYGNEAPTIPK